MAQYVEVKGQTIEFPDGMAAADIEKVIRQQMLSIKPAEQQKAPVEDPGFFGAALIGAGRTTDRVSKGMQQLYHGLRGNNKELDDLKQAAAEDDRLYKPLQEARPFATGLGESLPSMAIPFGASASLVGNAGRMALAGGIPAALEYGTAGDRAQRGTIGAATGAVVPVLGALAKSGKTFSEPLYEGGRKMIAGRALKRVAGDDAANVISKLQAARPLIPGSMPTAGQVAENGGIAAFERMASQADPAAYAQRGMEQASARLSALRGIAGDDAAIALAKGARDSAAKPIYDKAKQEVMQNSAELSTILDSLPKEVLSKAHSLAMLAREPLKAGKDIPAHTVSTGVLDASGKPFARDVAEQTSQYSGKALHYIKLALDDTLGKTGDGALGRTEKSLMSNAKDDLLGVIDSGIPSYGPARAKYAELSKPVNQMEIGQELYNKLKPALSDYGALGQESKAQFANALRNGDDLAANATGFKGAKLDSVMSPTQMAQIGNIAKDLARKANSENIGKGVNSDTFQKLSMQNLAEQSGMPRLVGGLLDTPGLNRATKWIYRDSDEKAQKMIAEALLNPQKAAELMTGANRVILENNPKLKALIGQSAMRAGGLLAGAAVPQQ